MFLTFGTTTFLLNNKSSNRKPKRLKMMLYHVKFNLRYTPLKLSKKSGCIRNAYKKNYGRGYG